MSIGATVGGCMQLRLGAAGQRWRRRPAGLRPDLSGGTSVRHVPNLHRAADACVNSVCITCHHHHHSVNSRHHHHHYHLIAALYDILPGGSEFAFSL